MCNMYYYLRVACVPILVSTSVLATGELDGVEMTTVRREGVE